MTGFVCIENPPLDKALTLIESEQKIIDTRNPSFINESKSSDR